MTSVAIIGAGMAGLTCARLLRDKGIAVTIFEKSRGVGGRLATRRAEPFYFDHGVASFFAKESNFNAFIRSLKTAGIVTSWQPVIYSSSPIPSSNFTQNKVYVGVGAMNAIGKYLAIDLDIRLNTRVSNLQILENNQVGWQLIQDTGENLGGFDWVIFAVPVAQANDFGVVRKVFGDLPINRLSSASALMLGFETSLNLPWQVFEPLDKSVAKIIVNDDKPGRVGQQSLVIQTTSAWTDKHIDLDKTQAIQLLIERSSSLLGIDLALASHKAIHHWRYANGTATDALPLPYLLDNDKGIALCGDWCGMGDVQSAYLSGKALAHRVIQSISQPIVSTGLINHE